MIQDNRETIPQVLRNIGKFNVEFVADYDKNAEQVQEGQQPRVIVYNCSDSRVDLEALGPMFNRTFAIETAGNRADKGEFTASGTYAADHIPSAQVVYVLGHTGCGAVTAAIGDHSGERADLKQYCDEMWAYLEPMKSVVAFAELNVDHQVDHLIDLYSDLVEAGKLTVIGGIFDIHGVYPGPKGTVTPINIEGIIQLDQLRRHEYLSQRTEESTKPFRFTQYEK